MDHMFRLPLFVFAFVFLLPSTQVQGDYETYTSEVRESKGAATLKKLNAHIRESEKRYRVYGQVLRIAFHDLAYPKDREEYRLLAGHGVVLVTTITQAHEELPITRVYFESGDRVVEFKKIKSKLTRVSRSDRDIRRTFGPYRMDGLYLFPVSVVLQGGDLKLDFARNRKGLVIGRFPPGRRSFYAAGGQQERLLSQPDPKALKRYIAREFPVYRMIR